MTDLKKFINLNNVLMLKMMNKEPIGKLTELNRHSLMTNSIAADEDTVIPDAPPVAKHIVPEVKTASPKQAPKGKKGKKRR